VWSKNTIFGVYSEKFRKVPILQQRLDLNPVPHGEAAADIAKMFEQNLQRKSEFLEKRFSQTSANIRFLLFVCVYVCIPQKTFCSYNPQISNFC
jgi:hypothetical protein